MLRRITNTQFGVGLLLLASIAVLLMAGSNYLQRQDKTGIALQIQLSNEDVTVYIDNLETSARFEEDPPRYLLSNLNPGIHRVLLGKSGYYPWQGVTTITASSTTVIDAFMIPMKPDYTEIPAVVDDQRLGKVPNPEYVALVPEWESTLTGSGKPILKDQNALTYSENDITLTWTGKPSLLPRFYCSEDDCATELPVYHGETPVKEAFFYPDRTNVLLFSAGTSVYAIEASRISSLAEAQARATGNPNAFARNFQPVYTGTDPHLLSPVDNIVTIKDGEKFIQVSL